MKGFYIALAILSIFAFAPLASASVDFDADNGIYTDVSLNGDPTTSLALEPAVENADTLAVWFPGKLLLRHRRNRIENRGIWWPGKNLFRGGGASRCG